jgi:hypothetical protein
VVAQSPAHGQACNRERRSLARVLLARKSHTGGKEGTIDASGANAEFNAHVGQPLPLGFVSDLVVVRQLDRLFAASVEAHQEKEGEL